MSMDLWIFDVGRGLCVAIRTPNNHLCLIDCGCSDDFSPIEWLATKNWTCRNNYKLAKLIITHPHIDHIADIENVTNKLKPSMILRRTEKNLDWKKVTSGGSGQSASMKHYIGNYMPPQYNVTITDLSRPDWGDDFQLSSYCLGEADAAKVSGTDSSYVNNSSYVNLIKYKGYCFAIPGDIESEGMAALLATNKRFCSEISTGIDFYLTPHHGHPSGFSADWFRLAGATNIMNIASERRKSGREDESNTKVDSRYSDINFCLGSNTEEARLVTTKTYGHTLISISDEGEWRCNWSKK